MSLEVTTRIWNNSSLKSGDKLLLLALGEMADNDGFCWPGMAKLAEMTGQSKRQLPRTMKNIRKSGEVIIWDQQGQSGGRGYTNIYLVITGLSREQIREIISRRFALMPDEIDSVLTQEGVIYDIVCQQKRMTPAALLRTRKSDISDTKTKKRVSDSAQKGDTSGSRTIINHNESSTTTAAERLTNFYLTYVNTTGRSDQTAVDIINDILATYPASDIDYAVKESIKNGADTLNYLEAICKRRVSGAPDKPKKASQNGRKQQRSNQPTNPAGASDAHQPGYILDQLPSVNIYTGEIVPPVDPQ